MLNLPAEYNRLVINTTTAKTVLLTEHCTFTEPTIRHDYISEASLRSVELHRGDRVRQEDTLKEVGIWFKILHAPPIMFPLRKQTVKKQLNLKEK